MTPWWVDALTRLRMLAHTRPVDLLDGLMVIGRQKLNEESTKRLLDMVFVPADADHVWRDSCGYDYDGYNTDGYNCDGVDRGGWLADDPKRFCHNIHGDRVAYQYISDADWQYAWDVDGYDAKGFNREGLNRAGDPDPKACSHLYDTVDTRDWLADKRRRKLVRKSARKAEEMS